MKRGFAAASIMVAVLTIAPGLADAPPPEHFALDPHAGSWVRGPSLPSPRQDAATAVLDGRIYIIGGFGPNASSTDTTYVLEPAAGTDLTPSASAPPAPVLPIGTWSTARNAPESMDHAAAAALDGYVYVAGGSVEKKVSNKFWRYDPIDDSWATMPPLPIPRYGATMQALDDKLYLIGGASRGDDERSIEVFDPATASWSLIENALTVEREGSATAIYGDRIALVGGHDSNERNMTSCDLFDPVTDAWSVCSSMHVGRSGFGLAAVDDRLFAIGGVNLLLGATTQTTEISGSWGRGWMDGHWLPAPRQGMSIAVIGHTVWVIGGSNWDSTSPTASVLRYVIPMVKVKFGGRAPQ